MIFVCKLLIRENACLISNAAPRDDAAADEKVDVNDEERDDYEFESKF